VNHYRLNVYCTTLDPTTGGVQPCRILPTDSFITTQKVNIIRSVLTYIYYNIQDVLHGTDRVLDRSEYSTVFARGRY